MITVPACFPRLRNVTAALICAGALAACGADSTAVRQTSQAVHPGSTVQATGSRAAYRASRLPRAQAIAQADKLFNRFCLNKSGKRTTEAAIRRSSKFDAPRTIKAGKARYVFYPLADGTRGGATVVYNSIGGLRCTVGVENIGPALYDNGTVRRPS